MHGTRNFEITPEQPAALATLADVKALLGIAGTDSDALLTRYLNAASATVEAYCDTVFAARAVVETLFPVDAITDVVLSFSPVSALTEVKRDAGADIVAEFEILKRAGILRRLDGSLIAPARYDVKYSAGYATIPPAIVEATILHVRDLYNSKDRKAGVSRESVPDVADVTYSTDYLSTGANGVRVAAEVASLLEPFRRRFAP